MISKKFDKFDNKSKIVANLAGSTKPRGVEQISGPVSLNDDGVPENDFVLKTAAPIKKFSPKNSAARVRPKKAQIVPKSTADEISEHFASNPDIPKMPVKTLEDAMLRLERLILKEDGNKPYSKISDHDPKMASQLDQMIENQKDTTVHLKTLVEDGKKRDKETEQASKGYLPSGKPNPWVLRKADPNKIDYFDKNKEKRELPKPAPKNKIPEPDPKNKVPTPIEKKKPKPEKDKPVVPSADKITGKAAMGILGGAALNLTKKVLTQNLDRTLGEAGRGAGRATVGSARLVRRSVSGIPTAARNAAGYIRSRNTDPNAPEASGGLGGSAPEEPGGLGGRGIIPRRIIPGAANAARALGGGAATAGRGLLRAGRFLGRRAGVLGLAAGLAMGDFSPSQARSQETPEDTAARRRVEAQVGAPDANTETEEQRQIRHRQNSGERGLRYRDSENIELPNETPAERAVREQTRIQQENLRTRREHPESSPTPNPPRPNGFPAAPSVVPRETNPSARSGSMIDRARARNLQPTNRVEPQVRSMERPNPTTTPAPIVIPVPIPQPPSSSQQAPPQRQGRSDNHIPTSANPHPSPIGRVLLGAHDFSG